MFSIDVEANNGGSLMIVHFITYDITFLLASSRKCLLSCRISRLKPRGTSGLGSSSAN